MAGARKPYSEDAACPSSPFRYGLTSISERNGSTTIQQSLASYPTSNPNPITTMTTILTQEEITDKITSSALLVSLQLGSYNPIKTDRSESVKVAVSHGMNANTRVMKVVKNTLPTAGVIKEIESLDGEIRAYVDKNTAPFARGIGMLPAVRFFDFREGLNQRLDKRDKLKAKLADEYTIYLDEAERELNGAFKPEDYPPVTYVVDRFYAKLDIFEISNPKDNRFAVLGSVAESIHSALADTMNDKMSSVTPFLTELMLKPLTHLSSVLQNPDHKLAQTAFSNAVDAADQAGHLNLIEDDQIRNAAYEIKACLDQDKDMVKDDDHLRARVLADCNRILQSLGGTVPAPAVHKPRASKKSKGETEDEFSETAPIVMRVSSAKVEEVHDEPTDEQIDVTADAADETFNPNDLLAKLGW